MADKSAYVLVRVPKSGSTSLQSIAASALPAARVFETPETARTISKGVTAYEQFRSRRRRWRHFMKSCGAWTEDGFWKGVNATARDGDIVAGHLCYGEPKLPDFGLNYITLLRDPRERMLSSFNYDRVGFKRRPGWRRAMATGQLQASGRTFEDYLNYIADPDRRAVQPASIYVLGDEDPADDLAFLKDRYFHFGVLDELDLFARGLGEKLGAEASAEWKNRTPKRRHPELSQAETRLIEKHFARDVEMYERARDFVKSQQGAG